MCVNLHIFRNFLVEVKRYAAIFLCIPTFKPVTVRFRIIGRGDSSSMLHHFAGSLCLTAAVKAHSRVRLHLAPMCVNLHIFRNFLVEVKRYAAIFLCIPTFKPVTVRCRSSGRSDLFSMLHHFGASLCLIAAVKVHNTGRLHLAPMCVNRHIFRNWLAEIKLYAAIFLCIPTFKLVTVRFRIIGRGDLFSILHHHTESLCLTAAVKVHSTVRLHLAPMCVNRHIFLNWLAEIKLYAAIFLCIPTFKLVTVRCWIIGRGDNSFILHHFAGFLCLIAVVKAHSRGIMKFLRIIQHGIHAFNRARVRMSIDHIRDFLIHQHIPLCLRSRIMQYL